MLNYQIKGRFLILRTGRILTEREFYAKLSTDIIKASNADSEFVLQGVID